MGISDKPVEVSAHTTRTKFDGVLPTTRSRKSFFQVTAGIPIELKFYLVGNAIIARGLFEYSGAAGLGAPVRVCVSQRNGEETRIDMDQPSAFFSQFPEIRPSSVPALLDAILVKVLEDAAT